MSHLQFDALTQSALAFVLPPRTLPAAHGQHHHMAEQEEAAAEGLLPAVGAAAAEENDEDSSSAQLVALTRVITTLLQGALRITLAELVLASAQRTLNEVSQLHQVLKSGSHCSTAWDGSLPLCVQVCPALKGAWLASGLCNSLLDAMLDVKLLWSLSHITHDLTTVTAAHCCSEREVESGPFL